jgi:hypothetical protein
MSKFLVLYMAPAAGMKEWMEQPEEVRKPEEEKMKADWDAWMATHGSKLSETAGAGKTKRVTAGGIADVSNDVMMFSMVEAESAEEAAKIFEGHPHFGIPGGWIDVMPANYLPGMA